ncbi:MAG: hypothetical protein HYU67_01425 [Flavobacteriia bacterium]|nr:hypothetical protein [Flavobacteriia bacterium]
MKNILKVKSLILLLLLIFSCKQEEKKKSRFQEENLVEIKNGVFTQFYPGKKHVKFQGKQDSLGSRDGKWVYKSPEGKELSITNFDHGKKHGLMLVKYPNGVLHYVGEWYQDKKIGVWRIYDEKGKLNKEQDFGTPK